MSKSKKCITPYCRCLASPGAHSPYCSKCRNRRFSEAHPASARFNDLRHRARQRGHEFTLTLDEFKKWWVESGIEANRGKTKDCFSIDRIKNHLGYVPGNLQVLTISCNARKQFVPFFKTKAEEVAAVVEQDDYMTKCQAIEDDLNKILEPDSDEWRAEYTRRTNAIKPE